MTTLIALHKSDGSSRRCDASCYNAAAPKCKCICQGRNHGKGLAGAIEQTNADFEDLKTMLNYANNEPQKLVLHTPCQPMLPTFEENPK